MPELSALTLPAVVAAYRTCELVTVGPDGTPTAWPASHVVRPGGTLLLTTSIGLPQKAFNLRRDPRVALLCSNPTASGLDAPEQVLVQGTAVCPDEVHASPAGLEDYWRTLSARQDSPMNPGNPAIRWSSGWYFLRLVLTVTPEAVTTLPALPGAEGLGTAVLASEDADGRLRLTRTPAVPQADGSLVLPAAPAGDPADGSRAGLLRHSHDERLWNLRCSNAVGTLELGDEVRFRPARVLAEADAGLRDALRQVRGARRAAAGYLRRRGLETPAIDWAGYQAVKAEGRRGTG